MLTPENIRETIGQYFAATRAMDVEAWLANFAADAASHDPVGAPPHEGHEGLRQFFEGMNGMFEKVGLTEEHVFVAANQAAVKWTGEGVAKNGRAVSFEGINLFDFNEQGKIQTMRAYMDSAALMAQLQGESDE